MPTCFSVLVSAMEPVSWSGSPRNPPTCPTRTLVPPPRVLFRLLRDAQLAGLEALVALAAVVHVAPHQVGHPPEPWSCGARAHLACRFTRCVDGRLRSCRSVGLASTWTPHSSTGYICNYVVVAPTKMTSIAEAKPFAAIDQNGILTSLLRHHATCLSSL